MNPISHKVSVPSGTLEFVTHDVNNTEVIFHPDHPWLYDLRNMSKMLTCEILIPHLLDGRDNSGAEIYLSNCDECLKALKLRNEYLAEKIRQANDLAARLGFAHPFPQ